MDNETTITTVLELAAENKAFWAAVDAADAAKGLAPIGTVERAIQAAWTDLGGVLA
jgi:hypothetical protein